MFCPQCGLELTATNQKFCHNCGTNIQTNTRETDYKTDRFHNEPASKLYYIPVKEQEQLKRGPPGKYSNFCFFLGLLSVIVGIVPFLFSYYSSYFYWANDSIYNNMSRRLILFVVVILLRVVGLTMSIFSRMNNSKAIEFEPHNDMEKVGSILGIFGIIVNVAGLLLSFIGPWSLFRAIPDYYYY